MIPPSVSSESLISPPASTFRRLVFPSLAVTQGGCGRIFATESVPFTLGWSGRVHGQGTVRAFRRVFSYCPRLRAFCLSLTRPMFASTHIRQVTRVHLFRHLGNCVGLYVFVSVAYVS